MLNETQVLALAQIVGDWAKSLRFNREDFDRSEEKFTAKHILPLLELEIARLLKPSLLVRGDGGSSMMPVVWSGLAFFPDLAVCEFETRHIAVEVKILRDKRFGGIDAGGALAKAIGQTVVYSQLGYKHSLGLVFDLRSGNSKTEIQWREALLVEERSQVHIFA